MSDKLKKTFEIVNAISPSFCAAKWYNASIWLGNGRTASCHHPAAHYIPLTELKDNASALHNTQFKKEQRAKMLKGVRPEECGYCWRVEDIGNPEIFSDRAHKSMIYDPADLTALANSDPFANIDPKTLEICFDNLCNLSCSYCNSEFSTTWSSDITANGPYLNMKTGEGHTYENNGAHAMPFGIKNEGNIYIEKFFEWYNTSLRNNLTELRVSGGEPSRSPYFWKLVDSFDNEKFSFAVNTNLIMDESRLLKLIDVSKHFDDYHIYTSCEGYGRAAEFVRAGLDYDQWKKNLFLLQTTAPKIKTSVMLTVSALSVWTIDKFVEDMMDLREKTNGQGHPPYHMSVNILRFPSFQSVNILPQPVKDQIATNIERATNAAKYLTEYEKNSLLRCVVYLRSVDTGYEDKDSLEDKLHDFKSFITQYSVRKDLQIDACMPTEFLDWFNVL